MDNKKIVFEKIKKYTMTCRARQMKLNVSKNPDEEVIALYDAEKKNIETGKLLAIIVNNPKQYYLRYRDKDEGFSKKAEIIVDGKEYVQLMGIFREKKDKLERSALSEIKLIESTYGRKKVEPKEEKEKKSSVMDKIKGITEKVATSLIDSVRLNDDDEYNEKDEYNDEEYDEEYDEEQDESYGVSDFIKDMIDKAENIRKSIVRKVKTKDYEPRVNIIQLDEYRNRSKMNRNNRRKINNSTPDGGPEDGPGSR